MNRLRLTRINDDSKQSLGIYEILNENNRVLTMLFCLELPWLNNKKKVSCILPAIYPLFKVEATMKIPYKHLWIAQVPNRSGIKIHKGSFYFQIEGCQVPGFGVQDLNNDGYLDVKDSTGGLKRLMDLLPNETTIEIIGVKV